MCAQLPHEKPSPGNMLVKWHLHVAFCGEKKNGSFELPERATDADIASAIRAAVADEISYGLTRIVR